MIYNIIFYCFVFYILLIGIKYYYYYHLILFLKKYNCNLDLFKYIYSFSNEIIATEISIKNKKTNRYTIPLRYKYIPNELGSYIKTIYKDISNNDDIIFGYDGNENIYKLYIDKGNYIYCIQTNNVIKHYHKIKNGLYKVYKVKALDYKAHEAHDLNDHEHEEHFHIRQRNNFIGIINNNIETEYIRYSPMLYLFLDVLMS